MIVVDANALVLLLAPGPAMTHVERGAERVAHFLAELTAREERILVPAPALAEFVAGGSAPLATIVDVLRRSRFVEVAPFDMVAAIECGTRLRQRVAAARPVGTPHWKTMTKYDAQIAAIAIARSARAILTDDRGIGVHLAGTSVAVIGLSELPLPPEDRRGRRAV